MGLVRSFFVYYTGSFTCFSACFRPRATFKFIACFRSRATDIEFNACFRPRATYIEVRVSRARS